MATDEENARFRIFQRENPSKSEFPTHCSYGPVDDDPFQWRAAIMGPLATPYEDGVFFLSIELSPTYPFTPPLLKFLTKVYHPNIDENGKVYVDFLEEEWRPVYCIETLLLSLCSLLADPNPIDPLNPISMVYREDLQKFNQIAREWTVKYAMEEEVTDDEQTPEKPPVPAPLSPSKSDFPTHCSYGAVDDDPFQWRAAIMGPPATPYEDGVFFVSIELSPTYPSTPPLLKFLTKVYHPNIDENGKVYVDFLEEEWRPVYCIETLLLSLRSLLADPNPVDPLNPISMIYREDLQRFNQIARQWTVKYAMEEEVSDDEQTPEKPPAPARLVSSEKIILFDFED